MFLTKENVLSPEVCTNFIRYFDNALDTAQVGENQEKEFVRRSEVSFRTKADTAFDHQVHAIFQILEHETNLANMEFGFDLYPLTDFQFTRYSGLDKQHYRWHPDDIFLTGRTTQRKLSLILSLNSHGEHYEGGELKTKELDEGEELIKTHELKTGTMIFFPSFLTHMVTPVESGVRYTIVSWVSGKKWS